MLKIFYKNFLLRNSCACFDAVVLFLVWRP
jgi:hypothetical protein